MSSVTSVKSQPLQSLAPAKQVAGQRRTVKCAAAARNADLASSLAQGVRQKINASASDVAAPTVQPVPGIEILPATSPSPPPPPPSQGMDFVLDKLSAQPPMQGVADPLQDASKTVLSAVDNLNGSASQAAAQASAAASEAANALGSAVGSSAAAASAAAEQVTGQLSGAASQLQGALDNILQQLGTETSVVQDNISSLTSGVQSTAVSTLSGVVNEINSQIDSLLNQLPPGVKDTLVAAGSEAVHLAQAAAANPQFGAAATGAGVGLPALLLWIAANGGFAGSLSVEKAEKMLQTQNAVLVDVRPEAKRLENGVAELKRGARGKGAALSPVNLPPSIGRRVRNADALATEMLGAQIAALGKLQPDTRVIIMDESGSKAKAIARAASAAGVRRAYILQGGFRAWTNAGLKVKTGTTEYDASPLDAVSDVAETVVEEATGFLKTPKNLAIGAGGALAAAVLALNYHLVFRYLGVVGIELTILIRALDYESPQDALDDLQGIYSTVAGTVSGVSAAAQSAASTAQQLQQQQQQQQESQPNES